MGRRRNKSKTRVISSEEIGKEIKYTFESKESNEGPIYEILKKETYDALAKAIVNHMLHEPKYIFDHDYCDEFSYRRSQEGFDGDKLVYIEGEFNPLDIDTLYDFMESSSEDYEEEYDWGKYSYRDITIENIVLANTRDILKEKYLDIKNKIKSLGEEVVYNELLIKSNTIITVEEVREHKITGDITREVRKITETKKIDKTEPKFFQDISIDEAIDTILGILELDEEYVADYFTFFYEDINLSRFKDIYLRGCELLDIEDNFYKKTEFTGSEKENFLFDILKESVSNNSMTDDKGKPVKAKAIDGPYKKNIFSKNGFTDRFSIDNSTREINDAIDYIRHKIEGHKVNNEEIDDYLKLLSAIYSYQTRDISLNRLKEVFKYDFLRNALLDTDIKFLIDVLYERCRAYEGIKNTLPVDPKDYYPMARKLKRHFILHIGPTNSGKTYESLEKFKKQDSGVYLAPLRLLALEVQEKMLSEDFKCSLITGEEESIIENSNHLCCTIEKLNFSANYDIAIIDEGQMLDDPQRGAAWTSAILGVCAKEIHVCCANYAQDMIVSLIEYCGDTYEVVNHSRDTELIVSCDSFDFLEDLQKGDAIVAFSKRKVLNLAATINTKTELSCSVLFGSLPYRSRKKQFQNFAEGKSDVLVTTDAIGMGVNLAIKRVIFMEDSKYDGKSTRKLKTSEILQIAGRAGRKNIYDQGFVVVTDKLMKKRYEESIPAIKKAYIGLTHHLGEIDGNLEDIIFAWQQLDFKFPFVKADISNQIDILNAISKIDLRKSDRFKAMFMPVSINSDYEMGLLKSYLKIIAQNYNSVEFPHMPNLEYGDELKQLESYSKGIDLYYSFCKTYELDMDLDRVEKEREATCNKINKLLLSDNLDVPRCNICGEELEWDYDRYRCPDCYSGRGYRNNSWYDEEDDWDCDWGDDNYI